MYFLTLPPPLPHTNPTLFAFLPPQPITQPKHSTLIFAALDTTSGAISRTLQLLSTHPLIQDRLRNEITEAQLMRGGEDLDFDMLDGLPYLDAVCAEVLRL